MSASRAQGPYGKMRDKPALWAAAATVRTQDVLDGRESCWVSGQVEPHPSAATRLGAELPSFSVHMCDTTWPLLWSPGRLCHMHVLMCAPGTLQWPGSKLSTPLSPAWPVTVTWPAGLWHSAPTAQAPQSPAQASETPVDFPPSLGSFPHRLGSTQPGLCSRGNGGVLSKPCGLHTEDS